MLILEIAAGIGAGILLAALILTYPHKIKIAIVRVIDVVAAIALVGGMIVVASFVLSYALA